MRYISCKGTIFLSLIVLILFGDLFLVRPNAIASTQSRLLTSSVGWQQELLPNSSIVDLVGSTCSSSICMVVGIQVAFSLLLCRTVA